SACSFVLPGLSVSMLRAGLGLSSPAVVAHDAVALGHGSAPTISATPNMTNAVIATELANMASATRHPAERAIIATNPTKNAATIAAPIHCVMLMSSPCRFAGLAGSQ